jgi:hypothetical protein
LQAATTLSWVPWGVPGDGNSLSANTEPGALNAESGALMRDQEEGRPLLSRAGVGMFLGLEK